MHCRSIVGKVSTREGPSFAMRESEVDLPGGVQRPACE